MTKTLKQEIAKLRKMKVNELQSKFAEVTGETTRSPNKVFLIRRISEALQAANVVPVTDTPVAPPEPEGPEQPVAVDGKLTRLDVSELQARYLAVVGRPTGSTNKAYIIWKICQARNGHISVGPRKSTQREGVTFKVLPLRMESTVVDKMDRAWRAHGIKNRTAFFRVALARYLKELGADDAAALLMVA